MQAKERSEESIKYSDNRAYRAAFHNLGCKVNAYETDVMEQMLRDAGFSIVPFEEEADVYIINTCTVTNIADRKSRQMLHRAKKKNPGAVVVAVGCYVQTGLEQALKDEGIDLCIGNNKKGQMARILADFLKLDVGERKEVKAKTLGDTTVEDLHRECPYEDMQLRSISDHTRAYIKIQDGCNQFCSYCIIPYSRGRVRSRRKEEILHEVEGLARKGIKEFVITGIHVSSYGCDLERPGERLPADCFGEEHMLDLLRDMGKIPGVERIRLSSLEPRIITQSFVEGLRGIGQICPHFHLSLQSGCDSVLKRMNRHYTTEDFKQRVEILRRAYPEGAITTDIIVGFPGETEEEFQDTVAFAKEIGFYEMHIFRYSKRQGTPAAIMKGQLTEAEKAARSDVLEELGEGMSRAFRQMWQGREAEVLLEEVKEIGGRAYMTGHTKEYVHVAIPVEEVEKAGNGSGASEGALQADGAGPAGNRILKVRLSDLLPGGLLLGTFS